MRAADCAPSGPSHPLPRGGSCADEAGDELAADEGQQAFRIPADRPAAIGPLARAPPRPPRGLTPNADRFAVVVLVLVFVLDVELVLVLLFASDVELVLVREQAPST